MSEYDYDVCLSFAGEQRPYVTEVATRLRDAGLRVFYDDFETVTLLGKDLYVHLDEVYRLRSAYCVVFVSADYGRKRWTSHELKSAQERALQNAGDYIIPVRFDGTRLPGLRDTIGYVDALRTSAAELAGLIRAKVRSTPPPPPDRRPRSTVLTAKQLELVHPGFSAAELEDLDVQVSAPLLAGAEPQAAADVLAVMDEPTATAILSRMHPRRAMPVVALLPQFAGVLRAAPAIHDCGTRYRGVLGRPVAPLTAVWSIRRSGFRQDFQHGAVHWTEDLGARPTRHAVDAHHRAGGGAAGRLGFPVTPELPAAPSPQGTDGVYQRFEAAWDLPEGRDGPRYGGSVYWSAEHGAHSVLGGIGEHYEYLGGTVGPLGFPTGGSTRLPTEVEASHQMFEGGVIYWREETDCVVVPSGIRDELRTSPAGRAWFPTGPAVEARSPFGSSGVRQTFTDLTGRHPDQQILSSAHGTVQVPGAVGALHEALGGPAGALGFPLSRPSHGSGPWRFEGGAVSTDLTDAFAMSGPTWELWQDDRTAARLGEPVTCAEPLVDTPGATVQFFQRGIVTVRDGVASWWVRPD